MKKIGKPGKWRDSYDTSIFGDGFGNDYAEIILSTPDDSKRDYYYYVYGENFLYNVAGGHAKTLKAAMHIVETICHENEICLNPALAPKKDELYYAIIGVIFAFTCDECGYNKREIIGLLNVNNNFYLEDVKEKLNEMIKYNILNESDDGSLSINKDLL